uniref:PH domain-containing protein n=2 Tax=Labrus bergylta TaxID=56723 RepID=A0A3Q3F161_9LABR
MKELTRFKPMQRHLFLYERALLFCKRREEHGEGCDKTPSYSFKNCLKMTAVGITENVKGDVKKFEIWYSGREEVYVVQAPAVEVKMAWLNELRRILTNQQKLLRDEAYQHGQMVGHMQLSPPYSESKQQRASVSSGDTESGRSSPDPQPYSPKHQHNRRTVQVYFDLKNQVQRGILGKRVQLLRLAFDSTFLLISQLARSSSFSRHLRGSGGVAWRSGRLPPI